MQQRCLYLILFHVLFLFLVHRTMPVTSSSGQGMLLYTSKPTLQSKLGLSWSFSQLEHIYHDANTGNKTHAR